MKPAVVRTVALSILLVSVASGQESEIEIGDASAFVTKYCVSCHGGDDPSGELDLAVSSLSPEMAREVVERVAEGDMPPRKATQPATGEREAFLEALRGRLGAPPPVPSTPGAVTVRRLSRTEYLNTIRDLLGVTCETAEHFPADDLAYGFDNVGDALSLSSLHAEKYLAAAEEVAEKAISVEPDTPPVRRFEAELMKAPDKGINQNGSEAGLYSSRTLEQAIRVRRDGEFEIRVRTWGQQAGPDVCRIELGIDDAVVLDAEVPEERGAPGTRKVTLRLEKGEHVLKVRFPNDYYDPDAKDKDDRDRNLHVDWVELEGPLDRLEPPWAHRWILQPDDGRGDIRRRATRVLKPLATRAWRRPPKSSELKRLVAIVDDVVEEEGTFEEGVREALIATLVSPRFLFRTEPRRRSSKGEEDLDDWSVATRLSYFIWSSLPDERLMKKAAEGDLEDPETVAAEARRLLRDVKASALATNFASQWLELRNLEDVRPDPERFPDWDQELSRSLRRETELFFEYVLRSRLPVETLLDADFTFVDARLARHYGMDEPGGAGFDRVPAGPRGGGLLTHASVLTVTSSPVRTSPVKRGKWILDNLLADPPGPPLPGVDSFEGEDEPSSAATLRERLAQHREDPRCATCHDRMDSLGLALENFDVVGRWRDHDGGAPVDASSTLADGTAIDGPEDLVRAVVETGALRKALLEKLFIYAVGRGPEPGDRTALENALASLPPEATIEDMILAVVRMDAFRRRSTGV